MSTLFNLKVPLKEKQESHHPWADTIKHCYTDKIKTAHNTINNPQIPKSKDQLSNNNRVTFTLIGNRVTKEFIHCANLLKLLHKYRWKKFGAPIIKGVTGVEWPLIWNSLKIDYGGLAYYLKSQVAVLVNDKFLGGDQQLIHFIEKKYAIDLQLDYYKESVKQFSGFIKSSGRPCVYLHFAINGEHVGTMIFILYSDILPNTCENFLRLCNTRKGGYSGTPVHRIVKDCWIQCGGYSLKETNLSCENFIVPHDRRGVLCMANNGRHRECSTQFFVLLQPAPWMAHKYVAFGQLIDGGKTLKRIESVPTWYESPTEEIVIHKTGILNMDCQDIIISKGTRAFIQGHIDDLVAVGNIFMEAIMEKVYLEIEFRRVMKLKQSSEVVEEEAAKGLHETRRFIRNKEEMFKQLEKNEIESDADVSDYEPEEYAYKRASTLKSPIEATVERPYYIPLTNVVDPDDVESTFDLKRFLRGDYCLECDLDKNLKKKPEIDKKVFTYMSDLYSVFDELSDEYASEDSLCSEDEKEIKRYIWFNVDHVSFAGGIIRNIAKRNAKRNLSDESRKSEIISDDELRRFRIALMEQRRSSTTKKVLLSAPNNDKDSSVKIKRRQTGFVRPDDLKRLQASMTRHEEEEEEQALRKVRIAKSAMSSHMTRPRRQTAFVSASGMDPDESDSPVHRQSVLTRLYNDIAADEPGPTLKDYKPTSATQKSNFHLLTYSPPNFQNSKSEDSNKDRLRRLSIAADDDSFVEFVNIQHGKQCARKVSSDYVKTIDQAEHKTENSIRSLEFAKTRPSMSVLEYQNKNKRHQKGLAKTKFVDISSSTKGLRLPGDTPLYSENDTSSDK